MKRTIGLISASTVLVCQLCFPAMTGQQQLGGGVSAGYTLGDIGNGDAFFNPSTLAAGQPHETVSTITSFTSIPIPMPIDATFISALIPDLRFGMVVDALSIKPLHHQRRIGVHGNAARTQNNANTMNAISRNNGQAFVRTPLFGNDPSALSQRRSGSSRSISSTTLHMKASTPPPYPVRVAVMGGGNFGLAMATVCARQGHPTTLLVRSEDIAKQINTNHTHPRYMSGIELHQRIRATTKPEECLPDATYIVHAVPCQYSRRFLNDIKDHVPPGTPILSVSKGIETASLGFMADILRECLGEDRPLAFLSGPSFAMEIVEGVATAVVIASEDLDLARDLAALLSDDKFKCFTSADVIGVEIGGAVKNVIAVGAGMCEGLGLGTNAMSGLVTRGCNEMRRLGLTFGARPSTIAGLSGVGDTFGTCFGPLSRNRKFGYRLGKGETMEEIRASTTEVAEGVDTALAVVDLIKTECNGYRMDLKYPILFGIARILEGKQTPLEGLEGLMNMPMQMENFDERYYSKR